MSRKDLLPAAGPVLTLRQALYRASRDYRGGQTALALDMGIEPADLSRRLNPADTRPIGAEHLEEILQLTRDERVLDAIGRAAGAVWFIPRAVKASHDAVEGLGAMLEREGQFVRTLHAGVADEKWMQHEVDTLEVSANRLIAEILGILAGAQAAVVKGGEIDG